MVEETGLMIVYAYRSHVLVCFVFLWFVFVTAEKGKKSA
jgi:hypothetical protein